jgi:hypothetical protein
MTDNGLVRVEAYLPVGNPMRSSPRAALLRAAVEACSQHMQLGLAGPDEEAIMSHGSKTLWATRSGRKIHSARHHRAIPGRSL